MSSNPTIPTPLTRFDGPITPDPRFAAEIESLALSSAPVASRSAGAKSAEPVSLTEWQQARPGGLTFRRRLLDLAAVAALLLAMIGGLVRVTGPGYQAATSTSIAAPTRPVEPVQIHGTAAQDGQFGGPAPTSGTAVLDWRVPVDSNDLMYPLMYPSIISGDTLYSRLGISSSAGTVTLIAFDLKTHERLWDAPVINAMASFAVTDVGIVAAVPSDTPNDGSDAVNPFKVALLDRIDGHTIWTAFQTFNSGPIPMPPTMTVSSEAIYLTTGDSQLVALSLEDGARIWSYEWVPTLHADVEADLCRSSDPVNQICMARDHLDPFVAVLGSTLYLADNQSLQMSALDARTGELHWATDLIKSAPGYDWIPSLTAVDSGVAVLMGTSGPMTDRLTQKLAVFSEDSGQLLWANTDAVGSPVVANGSTLFTTILGGSATYLTALDATTGTIDWQYAVNGSPIAYLTNSDEIAVYQDTDQPVFGLDAATGDVTWSVDSGTASCRITFPGNDDGSFACYPYSGGGIDVIHIAASAASTPITEAIQTNGTAAQDKQYTGQAPMVINQDVTGGGAVAGPAPETGPYTRVWSQPEAADSSQPAAFLGDLVYALTKPAYEAPGTTLTARDRATSDLRWQTVIAKFTDYILTDQGIVALIPNDVAHGPLMLARFDPVTGERLWAAPTSFKQPEIYYQLKLTLAGDKIVVANAENLLQGYRFDTGESIWNVEIEPDSGTVARCDVEGSCLNSMTALFDLVSSSDTVYLADLPGQTVSSIDAATGRLHWSVSVTDRSALDHLDGINLAVTDRGLVVQYRQNEEESPYGAEQFELWSVADDSVQWSITTGQIFGAMAIIDGRYLALAETVQDRSPYPCCDMVVRDLIDGSEAWRLVNPDTVMLIGYLPEARSLLLQQLGYPNQLLGVDVDVHTITWRFSTPDLLCGAAYLALPVGPDGAISCGAGDRVLLLPESAETSAAEIEGTP